MKKIMPILAVGILVLSGLGTVVAVSSNVALMDNHPPSTPTIDGPVRGMVGVEYPFTFNSTDPDGDNITYIVYWDDGTGDECGPYYSGIEVTINHTWNVEGAYTFTAHAKDVHGLEGPETFWCIGIGLSKDINQIQQNGQQHSQIIVLQNLKRLMNRLTFLELYITFLR